MKRLGLILSVLLIAAAGNATAVRANVMLGAHIGRHRDPNWQMNIQRLEMQIGHKLGIDNDHEDWQTMPNNARMAWDLRNRRLPMISWSVAFHKGDRDAGCATADEILRGRYDAQLDQQAKAVASFRAPILIRFNYEMTGNACFYGFPVRENPRLAGSKFITVWKYVVAKFRKVGATNAKWVWSPGHKAYATGEWRLFYPGAAYVDWFGIDYYNKSDTPRSFAADSGINAFYRDTEGLGKPLMVAETGANSDQRQHPDPQTLWLTTARAYLKSHPAIKAFVYWANPGKFWSTHPGYGGAGYILEGPGLAAFKAMADDPYFQ